MNAVEDAADRQSPRFVPAFPAAAVGGQVVDGMTEPTRVRTHSWHIVNIVPTELPDLVILEPRVFADERGTFSETFRVERFAAAGLASTFVQDNVSVSRKNVIRGLHFQHPRGQQKLVCVVQGAVWDVAVDIRTGSPTRRRWVATCLSEHNRRQLLVPAGFAHGFAVLSEQATVVYKCSDYYDPESERSIRWDDDELAIDWPVRDPVMSLKDQTALRLRDLPMAHVPEHPHIRV